MEEPDAFYEQEVIGPTSEELCQSGNLKALVAFLFDEWNYYLNYNAEDWNYLVSVAATHGHTHIVGFLNHDPRCVRARRLLVRYRDAKFVGKYSK